MPELHIEYATASDGVGVGYWCFGEGAPVIQLPPIPFPQVEVAYATDRAWRDIFLSQRMLVRYDARGTGVSERKVGDFSLEAHLSDLDAVAGRMPAGGAALWGQLTSGPIAIAYTARHPERVSHLILWSTWARTAVAMDSPPGRALRALMETDWPMFTEAAAQVVSGWSVGDLAHRVAAYLREGVDEETARAMMAAALEFDVSDLLPEVRTPTLVLQPRESALPDPNEARALAARIPGARLILSEGAAAMRDWSEPVTASVREFIGVEGAPAREESPAAGSPLTILFTDIEDSTAITQRLGDARAQDLLRAHNVIVREALRANGGTEVKHTGDGIMASFATASSALQCAVAVQRAVDDQGEHGSSPLRVHIGLNAGEPVAEEGDLFGSTVQLARRICDAAGGGEILAANVVRELAAGKGFLFADRGEVALRGFEEPVRLYEVRWRGP